VERDRRYYPGRLIAATNRAEHGIRGVEPAPEFACFLLAFAAAVLVNRHVVILSERGVYAGGVVEVFLDSQMASKEACGALRLARPEDALRSRQIEGVHRVLCVGFVMFSDVLDQRLPLRMIHLEVEVDWMQAVVIDLFNTFTLERAERNPEGAAVHPNSHIRVADAQRLESSVVIGRLLDAFKPLD